MTEAYERYRTIAEGATSEVYPALARVTPDLFGVCAVGTSGSIYGVGDTEHEFSVRGQLAAAFLSRRLGLDLFVSEPDAEV